MNIGRRRISIRRILFVICFLIAVWNSEKSVQKYLLYDIKTSVTYSNTNKLQFPSITMCNTNMFRRSIVGPSNMLMMGLVKFFSQSSGSFAYLYEKNVKTCKPNNNTDAEETVIDKDPLAMLEDLGFDGIIYKLGMNSDISLKKCWWQNVEFNCSQYIINHFTDRGLCFTIKPSDSENVIYKTIMGSSQDKDRYLTGTKSGPNNGLKMLLSVNQEEFCGYWWDFGGFGFRCYIHDANIVETFHSDQGLINIHAGKSYNILLKPRTYNKKTEFMGRCKSKMILPNLNIEGEYLNSMCVFLCYVQYIHEKCSCLPVVINEKNIATFRKVLNINSAYTKMCTEMEALICFNTNTEYFLYSYDIEICTHCLPQCTETMYDQIISEIDYPSQLLNLTDEKMFQRYQKNDILLNIYFGSTFVETVAETQLYSITNLLMSIGGNFCLLVGASFVSMFMPFYGTVFGLQKLFMKSSKKVKRTLSQPMVITNKEAKWQRTKCIKIKMKTIVINTNQVGLSDH